MTAVFRAGAGRAGGPAAGGPSRGVWTLVGLSAVPLWATWPALAAAAAELPSFQIVAMAQAVGAAFLGALGGRGSVSGWTRLRAVTALACAGGLLGSSAGFLIAAERIPPATANLISYLWPVWMVLIAGAAGLARLGWRHAAALGLGFAGAAAVIGGGGGPVDLAGAAIALLAGLSWSLFCVWRMGRGAAAGEVLAGACAAGAAASAAIHLAVETTVAPSAAAWLAVAAIGVGPLALANHVWDLGMRRGDGRTLAVAAYGTPLVSAMLLAALGLAEPSLGLALGAGLIVAAGMVAARAG